MCSPRERKGGGSAQTKHLRDAPPPWISPQPLPLPFRSQQREVPPSFPFSSGWLSEESRGQSQIVHVAGSGLPAWAVSTGSPSQPTSRVPGPDCSLLSPGLPRTRYLRLCQAVLPPGVLLCGQPARVMKCLRLGLPWGGAALAWSLDRDSGPPPYPVPESVTPAGPRARSGPEQRLPPLSPLRASYQPLPFPGRHLRLLPHVSGTVPPGVPIHPGPSYVTPWHRP